MTIWTTPPQIFGALDREFRFVIDLCADTGNQKCPKYFERGSSLHSPWEWCGWAWLNPPYGKEISQWMAKAARSRMPIVAFLPGRTNAPWWHDDVMKAHEIRFVRRKVSFEGRKSGGGTAMFSSIIAIFDGVDNHGRVISKSWDWKAVGETRKETGDCR